MSDHYDNDRRAMERAEADYLREPAWRTSAPCQGCGEECSDGTLCETCAEEIAALDDEPASEAP